MRKQIENVILCSLLLLDKEKRENVFYLLDNNIFTEERRLVFEAICKHYEKEYIDILDILNELSNKIDKEKAIFILSDILYYCCFINTKNIKEYIKEVYKIIEKENKNKLLLEEYKKLKEEIYE